MDPDVGMWIQMCRGRVLDVNEDSVSVMGLQAIINLLAPVLPATKEVEEFRALNIHTAGADAKMHCLIYLVLREMADKASTSASTDFSLESQKNTSQREQTPSVYRICRVPFVRVLSESEGWMGWRAKPKSQV